MSDRARLICASTSWPPVTLAAGRQLDRGAGMTQQQVWDWIGANTYYGLPSATPRLADVP